MRRKRPAKEEASGKNDETEEVSGERGKTEGTHQR